jgi:hypothetical protein
VVGAATQTVDITTLGCPDVWGSPCDYDPKKPCTYAQHTKLIVVDDRIFYLGPKNAYPAFLQDNGYFVEDPAAVPHIRSTFLDRQWMYAKATAAYDWETNLPPTVHSLSTEETGGESPVTVRLRATTATGGSYMVAYGDKLGCKDVPSGDWCSFGEGHSIVGKKIDIVDKRNRRWTSQVVPHW